MTTRSAGSASTERRWVVKRTASAPSMTGEFVAGIVTDRRLDEGGQIGDDVTPVPIAGGDRGQAFVVHGELQMLAGYSGPPRG